PTVAGTAPPAYDQTRNLISVDVSTGLTGHVLRTGVLIVHAASPVLDQDAASADATVDATRIDLAGVLPLLTIGVDVVQSKASITGPCGGTPVAAGSTILTNARFGGPLGLGLTVAADPQPNTVLLDAAGIRVVLNEQTLSRANGVTALTVDAIHVYLNALPVTGLGVLSGEIVVSHSQARLSCPLEEASLQLGKSAAPDPVQVGGDLVYTLTVSNGGPGTARQTVVTDPLPASVTFVSAVPSQGSCSGTTTVVCNVGDLAPGGQATISITVQPSQGGSLTNTATAVSSTPDLQPGNHPATVTSTVFFSGLHTRQAVRP
ncbi:MAG: DUF11 domain-containing protein, partial [Acidobacteriota bacterium]|nr:DUF11 domain-containing protein [Acidobacteriota bacterium]